MRKKTKTVVIGAGKIAYTISAALFNSGAPPSAIISRNPRSAEDLAYAFSVPIHSGSLSSIKKNTNIIILSTPDTEIQRTAKLLSALDLPFEKILFIHLSGALSLNLLAPLERKGALTGSLHIMHTFPNKTPQKIEGLPAAIEYSSPRALKEMKSLCGLLKIEPFFLEKGKKTLYHIAGVFAANFLNGNLSASREIAADAGVNDRLFSALFIRITEKTLANIKRSGIEHALSGPVERNDVLTVKEHIKQLRNLYGRKNKNILCNYLHQSLLLTEAAEKKNPGINYRALKHLLICEADKIKN
ncbi:MAG: DUF2520 domain-containing protein [Ignavibacteriaceae bacterium]|nr:DUF2520 domain-containing protein [Ignavibacteriaceae bacterium]